MPHHTKLTQVYGGETCVALQLFFLGWFWGCFTTLVLIFLGLVIYP